MNKTLPQGARFARMSSIVAVTALSLGLAACDKAPMCQVNGADTYNLTPESFRELIRGLKSKG